MTSSSLVSRVRKQTWHKHFTTPEALVQYFKPGSVIGLSGFAVAGYPKATPIAVADYVERNKLQGQSKFELFSGASLGAEVGDRWAKLKMLSALYPYQSGANIQRGINTGEIKFKDIHLSNFANSLAYGLFKKSMDIAVLEASEVLPDGGIVLTSSCGISQEISQLAKHIIIEINTAEPLWYGIHDIIEDVTPPHRKPMLITHVNDRIGEPVVRIDPDKIVGIVESTHLNKGRPLDPGSEDEEKIAQHLIDFFQNEIKQGRLPAKLLPLQSGVGSIAAAVVKAFGRSSLKNLVFWTEVVQDPVLDLLESGQVDFASTASLSLTQEGFDRLWKRWEFFKQRIMLRPQAVTNHPEIVRRIGVLAMNTPVEIDIYGHANSTHVNGTRLLNGLGGSGDFLRNAFLSFLHTPSTRPTSKDPLGISCVVPFCSHVDHTEHDVLLYVTEQGIADTRGMAPLQRAVEIINKCAHPSYRDQLMDYYERSKHYCLPRAVGHEPHLLSKVFKMHENLAAHGTMRLASWD